MADTTTTSTLTPKQSRCLSAWNAGEVSAAEIAREFRVSSSKLRGWIESWLAAGLTTRPLRQQSNRASRTGRLL